jgi:hypothetical protein
VIVIGSCGGDEVAAHVTSAGRGSREGEPRRAASSGQCFLAYGTIRGPVLAAT